MNALSRLLLSVLLFGLCVTAQADNVRELRLGLFVPETHVHVREALIPWVNEVNERIEPMGYRIRMISGGALGRSALLQDRLLRTGVLDITWFLPGYSPGRFPGVELTEFPLLDDDPEKLTRAFWRMYEQGHLPCLDDVRPLALSVSPAYHMHLTFPLNSLEDLAGRKIRVNDASEAQVVMAMGGTPVAGIGANELAESLSRGLVEGALFSWHAMPSLGIDRVTDVHMNQPLTFTPSVLAMNNRTFARLPDDVRRVVEETSGESLSLAYTRAMLGGAQAAVERARTEPHRQFYEPTGEDRQRIADVMDRLRERWQAGDEDRVGMMRVMESVLAQIDAEGLAGARLQN